jgi:anthranilate phosphoribosyltransferase
MPAAGEDIVSALRPVAASPNFKPDQRTALDQLTPSQADRFATYVATLGRGPGRSRALTRDEARDAFTLALAGDADPHQLGAFLMLLRYRGEDPEEITGLVEASRDAIGSGPDSFTAPPDLDWPSYGSGRTRGAPWFLLSALALAASGTSILMHGTNEFTGGITVERALAALGRPVATSIAQADQALAQDRFAFLPLASLSAPMAHLIGLRRLLGLRSPVNTVARLLDPANALASVDGVFHPPYIALHLAVAERLDRARLLVLKGGGGEAERAPGKPVAIHLHERSTGDTERLLPALMDSPSRPTTPDTLERLVAVWNGTDRSELAAKTAIGTIAMALLALRGGDIAEADHEAEDIWQARHA